MLTRFLVLLLTAVSVILSGCTAAAAATAPRKIVLIAGKKSHGPGAHEYVKSVKLLKVMLDRSNAARGIRTEIHFNGWPEDPTTLDTADTIMTISDGQDGDKYSPVPFLTPERMAILEKQMRRGCGFVTFHFSTFTPDRYGEQILEWGGGYFDWQDDAGNRNWYSAIKTLDTRVAVAAPQHPITRGVTSFDFKEEFYYNLRFRPNDPRLIPILRVPALHPEVLPSTVAWAVQRTTGRGFGTTTGHFFDNWKNANYRKLILNAILWTANAEVPANGVDAPFVEDSEVDRALVPKPIRALLITGDHHPGHKWKETTPALIEALHSRGPEFAVRVSEDPDTALADPSLQDYPLVLLNYCNWTTPGLSEAAKANFIRYLRNGGGLAIIHFANGAFHASLPQAPPSDWPEYRKIVARVWNGAKDKSGHDRYGPLRVNIIDHEHPVTKGMPDFDAVDELYFRQEGDVPVTVLATAHSRITDNDEPMAMVYRYGKARVFQTVLGHSAESINSWGETQLIRRGCAWAATPARR